MHTAARRPCSVPWSGFWLGFYTVLLDARVCCSMDSRAVLTSPAQLSS
jgi:hypothetical protein